MQRCSAHGCKNEWGEPWEWCFTFITECWKYWISCFPRFETNNATLQYIRAEIRVLFATLQMQNKWEKPWKSGSWNDLGVFCIREMVAVHGLYETKNECGVAADHKNYVTRGRSCTAARCFYTWDGLWTNCGQKAGHLSGHSFLDLGGFMGQWKNCCLVQIGIFPIRFQLISKDVPR